MYYLYERVFFLGRGSLLNIFLLFLWILRVIVFIFFLILFGFGIINYRETSRNVKYIIYNFK